MSKQAYKIRDGEGTVIGQYYSKSEPDKPDDWSGDWKVDKVDKSDLNSERVEWWHDQS